MFCKWEFLGVRGLRDALEMVLDELDCCIYWCTDHWLVVVRNELVASAPVTRASLPSAIRASFREACGRAVPFYLGRFTFAPWRLRFRSGEL